MDRVLTEDEWDALLAVLTQALTYGLQSVRQVVAVTDELIALGVVTREALHARTQSTEELSRKTLELMARLGPPSRGKDH